ncbi:phosphatidate cytidylyltransferase [Sporosarcina sp. PTS2304]|uniref:phosphatidate cytidylyltransferase n=1 Tax=Sporosarcina sp. PTS2304 TaxID=2283194 RepID=UPI000E0D95E4|nr:phosphatidate cytidylyltransferase [Sporosarcina sp. PTS2304]AXH98731.1 phosphatidate cytidylyltransferase [Sporosarcina sp. PTS2304]
MKQRIITAIVALALFVPLIVMGGLPFIIAIFAIATIGLYELLRMRNMSIFTVGGFLSWCMLVVILLPSQWTQQVESSLRLEKLELLYVLILLLLIYTVVVKNRSTFEDIAFSAMCALYVGIGFYYLIETRLFGLEYIGYALLIIWSTDSGAYFVGRKLGKRKLWPEISPNKTIEGFVGGIVCAVVLSLVYNMFYPIANSYMMFIIITVVASIVGQMGDLVESALKRYYNVKDSGTLLPGHGGIMDRFDSLLFVLPLLHFVQFVG